MSEKSAASDADAEADVFHAAAMLHARLLELGETVAVAESLTGGLLSARLTSTPGSSATFRGGLVVYATDLKATLAGVDVGLLSERGPVDPAVAESLARGARERLGASWGIGVTGVAGPEPQGGQPVGTVFLALVGPNTASHAGRGGSQFSTHAVAQLMLSGDRNTIRRQSVERIVELFLETLAERS
ncbi:MAG: damage-inducible protein CinA [Frankiales bacterium]|nr:damage-inducible protein CinA [Frankiales bacterium]